MAKPSREEALQRIREEEIEDLTRRKARDLGLPYVDLLSKPIDGEALKTLPRGEAETGKCVVFEKKRNEFNLAALDPENEKVKEIIRNLAKFGKVNVFLASTRGLGRFLNAYLALPHARETITGEVFLEDSLAIEFEKGGALVTLSQKLNAESPETGILLQWLLATAFAEDASDIHIEPGKEAATLRFRLDGILYPAHELTAARYEKLRDRIKLVSGLKLNIREKPQDGRFTIRRKEGEPVEVRTSSIPGPQGENLVLRILDPRMIQRALEDLGLREDDREIIVRELKKPNGLILVTGPTGSGKTTTLYAFLRKINAPGIKVITIENPIEYRIPGVEQTQVDEATGYTFANGLKSILRQDPDVILVGEIRDLETAGTAMHASLTGHLVFSTLHTNDASGTIPRLIDLGAKPSIIAPALNLALAQRLLRRLCPDCAKTVPLDATTKGKLSSYLSDLPSRVKDPLRFGTKIKKANPSGCARCGHRGYKGRVGVFELFTVGPEMEKLIHQEPSEEEIRELAKKLGMVTMMQDAFLKVLRGITDLSEVERVVGPI